MTDSLMCKISSVLKRLQHTCLDELSNALEIRYPKFGIQIYLLRKNYQETNSSIGYICFAKFIKKIL